MEHLPKPARPATGPDPGCRTNADRPAAVHPGRPPMTPRRRGSVGALLATAAACAPVLGGCGTSQSGAPAGPGGATASSRSRTTAGRVLPALDGVYVSDVTAAELLSHGSTDALDENF